MDPYSPTVSLGLGDAIPYFYDRFLKMLGKDEETTELKRWFEELQKLGVQDASLIQCVGMHAPLTLEEIYRPTKLDWQTSHLVVTSVAGKRSTITLPNRSVSAATLLGTDTDALITAGPGWGKTTLLHYLLVSETKKKGRYIPILITLRRPGAFENLKRLVDALASIKRLSKDSSILLLVDGYDEVDTAQRKRISELLLRFKASGAGRLYLTCRDYYDVYDLNIPRVRVAAFDDIDQEVYASNFVKAYGSKIDPVEMLSELRQRGLKDLLTHPLLLALCCIVRSGSADVQVSNVPSLIERAVDTLAFRWDEGKGIPREKLLPVDGKSRLRCLMKLAFLSSTPDVKHRRVLDIAKSHLERQRHDDLDEMQFMLENARFYGILIPEGDMWHFVHKTIHDYLAARYWVESGSFKAEKIQEWDTRAAYAACLLGDATDAMKNALSHREWLPHFVEMLSNDAEFDHGVVAHALIKHLYDFPRLHFFEKRVAENRIQVQLTQDFIAPASSRFLHTLALVGASAAGRVHDTVFSYALSELSARGMRLSRTEYAEATRKYGPRFTFVVHKGRGWDTIRLSDMNPE